MNGLTFVNPIKVPCAYCNGRGVKEGERCPFCKGCGEIIGEKRNYEVEE